jgi:hypothetical protein
MRKIILGFFCFISLSVSAQDYVFRNYSVLNELFAKDSYHHVNGEVFVVGKTTQNQGFLSKYDAAGHLTSVQYVQASALSSFNQLSIIEKYSDTTFLIGGRKLMDLSAPPYWESLVTLVDHNGNMLWTNTTNYGAVDSEIKDIFVLSNGNIAIVTSTDNQNQSIIEMLDPSGNSLGSNLFSMPVAGFEFNDLLSADNQNLIVCGSFQDRGISAGIVAKLDSNGTILWSKKYEDPYQPNFIQLISLANSFVIANRGNAGNQIDLVQIDSTGALIEQLNLPSPMSNFEEDALKPLFKVDSANYWYWIGGAFGSNAYSLNENGNLTNNESFFHWGNIQNIEQDTSGITMLSNGPMYGIKNQTILQKHFSISHADSISGLFNFCSYSNAENPIIENSIIQSNILIDESSHAPSSPTFIGFDLIFEWIQEPFCVEFLGGIEEQTLSISPNPCNEYLQIIGFENQSYQLFDLIGNKISSGTVPFSNRISTSELNPGSYFLTIGNCTSQFMIVH